ncbi:hypothetical protein OS493_009587 [Desmophyllum pertusum]|uniref:Uncharacterized protein n=1 Tax=Desmophyllum pertusum TaxID=174260 RepID=A0A9W9YR29_9CNID|nr:hypothetical protein OS493_009587 [Desmophyllum pertusum]
MEKKLSRQSKYNRKIESLCNLLCDRLTQTAALLCETQEFQSTGGIPKDRLVSFGGKIEGVIRFCSLVCEVMVYLLKSNSLTQEEVRNLPVVRKLGNLLKKVAKGVNEISTSHEVDIITRMEVCLGVITEMEHMFTMLPAKANSPEQFVGMVLREKTSSLFLNVVLVIYCGEVNVK